MCTVVIRVSANRDEPVRLLAVRDEDPDRGWRPLGQWWPDRPGAIGIMDELAGGAWLAADPATRRLAVCLNREGAPGIPDDEITSRGTLVLASVDGHRLPDRITTFGFNLVEVEGGSARVSSWDGADLRVTELTPGTHMIAHDDLDDERTARIAAWLGDFAAAATDGDPWWDEWLGVLADTTVTPATDDRAIIRDNHPHGYPTLSLLVAVASVGADGMDVRNAVLDEPGVWNPLSLR